MTERSAIIVGASGAIGTALADHFAEAGAYAVHRISRSDANGYDMADPESLGAALDHIGPLGSVERIIIATGVLHHGQNGPEKSMRTLDAAWLERQFRINCLGPSLLLAKLLPQLNRASPVRVGVLSARVGSISDNRLGGWYGYRASKAALNQMVRTLAIEWHRTHPLAALVALHPGTVASRLSAPFTVRRDASELRTPADAAAQLAHVLDSVSPADSGRFIDYDGREIMP